MKERITLSKPFRMACFVCMAIGIVALSLGFMIDATRTWASYLLNNFYFFSLAIGAAFFLGLQSITQAGWSSGFRRIPEAMMMYLPFAGVLFLFLYFGMHSLYQWTNHDVATAIPTVEHKSAYLNIPFFLIRIIVFFFIWIVLTGLMRKASIQEDEIGGIENFRRIEWYSKVLIFFLAVSFSLTGFDLLMSIDAEWFSTIYALKNFIASFLHSSATIFIILLLLNRKGYYEFLNINHVHDFARYLFIVGIFYGYFWFSQFMLIWYGNIPEETIYYAKRWEPGWHVIWALDIIINWGVPFFVLLPVNTSRNRLIVFAVALILAVGLWIDLFVEIYPGAVGTPKFGWIEIGTFLGIGGLFTLVTGYYLSKANLVPKNHPYIQESYQHHFESYI